MSETMVSGNPNARTIETLSRLGKDLHKQLLNNEGEPSADSCDDILKLIEKEAPSNMTIDIAAKTCIGKMLVKSIKSLKRHSRTSNEQQEQWKQMINTANSMVEKWKNDVAKEEKKNKAKSLRKEKELQEKPGYPANASVYKTRLINQKKEIYKDPPVMPPSQIKIYEDRGPTPKIKKNGDIHFEDYPDFTPNRTPEQVLRAGSFGGTYFRNIVSAVTGITYNSNSVLSETCVDSWLKGLDKRSVLTSQTYRNSINKYKVKCGGSLGMWESSGWITDVDPYGWFQWYCRFYQGRRCSDDERQISRWSKSAGPKGRFRSQLCNKCIAAKTTADDPKISPVIRQTLLHWGYELTEQHVESHAKRKK